MNSLFLENVRTLVLPGPNRLSLARLGGGDLRILSLCVQPIGNVKKKLWFVDKTGPYMLEWFFEWKRLGTTMTAGITIKKGGQVIVDTYTRTWNFSKPDFLIRSYAGEYKMFWQIDLYDTFFETKLSMDTITESLSRMLRPGITHTPPPWLPWVHKVILQMLRVIHANII